MSDLIEQGNSLPIEFLGIPIKTMEDVVTVFKEVKSIPTPKEYIKSKQGFPYLPQQYVDDTFNRVFPLSSNDLVSRTETDYWINYTVKVTVLFPNGITMSKLGSAGARKQVSRSAKEAFLEKGIPLNPFDFVDNSSADKAALTMAIKNAQERFGIGADVTGRLILSSEQLAEMESSFDKIFKHIESDNPRQSAKYKQEYINCKSIADKMRLLKLISETYEIDEILNKE